MGDEPVIKYVNLNWIFKNWEYDQWMGQPPQWIHYNPDVGQDFFLLLGSQMSPFYWRATMTLCFIRFVSTWTLPNTCRNFWLCPFSQSTVTWVNECRSLYKNTERITIVYTVVYTVLQGPFSDAVSENRLIQKLDNGFIIRTRVSILWVIHSCCLRMA